MSAYHSLQQAQGDASVSSAVGGTEPGAGAGSSCRVAKLHNYL